MPQMAPISWLILFFIFSCAFLMFNMLNYYCNLSNLNNNLSKKINFMNNNKKIVWKW